jgi:hypothetical protein
MRQGAKRVRGLIGDVASVGMTVIVKYATLNLPR